MAEGERDKVVPLRVVPREPDGAVPAAAVASMLEKVDEVRERIVKGEIASIAIATVTVDLGIGSSWDCQGAGAWSMIAALRRLTRSFETWAFD